MGEWGLQAIIRPHLDDDHFGSIDDMIKQEYDHQAQLVFCYPHLFDNQHGHDVATNDDELNQLLYKPPFYNNPPVSAANNNIQTSDQEIIQQDQEIKNISGSANYSNASQLAPKLKKSRKNQQKRVVVQVTAAGLSSDPWAWRKYGQKPIKGSIYPRSYYRCSSSKGCMARRQVEQSCSDSSIYILTYTADHNHPQPTRRNSLAGINRKPTPNHKTLTQPPFHSPSLLTINEDDHHHSNIKQLETATLYNKCDIKDEDFMVFTDDFFEGLEDLGAAGYYNKIMESSSSSAANYNYSSTKHYVS